MAERPEYRIPPPPKRVDADGHTGDPETCDWIDERWDCGTCDRKRAAAGERARIGLLIIDHAHALLDKGDRIGAEALEHFSAMLLREAQNDGD